MNRYDEINLSTYNPRSLQETMMVPVMRRQQHDLANQQLQTKIGELDKIDPLNQHFEEAQKLKSQLRSQIDEQANKLSTQGFTSDTTSNIYKTNREIADMYSPTGRIGKINAAKIQYGKQLDEYLDDATKTKGWSRERALANWQNEHAKNYTGYNANKDVVNIDSYGAPVKVNVIDKLKDVKGILGDQVVSEMNNNGYSLKPQSDGSVILVNRSGHRIVKSNQPNIDSALALLNEQFRQPEWQNSMKFEGVDPKSVAKQILSGTNAMLNVDVNNTIGDSASLSGYTNPNEKDDKDAGIPSYINDPNSAITVGQGKHDINFNAIGSPSSPTGVIGSPTLMGTSAEGNGSNGKKLTYKDVIHDSMTRKYYEVAADRLMKAGRLPKGTNISDKNAAEKISFYMKNHMKIPTIQTAIVQPDISPESQLFMGRLASKDPADRNETINQQVSGGFRKMIDPTTGKPMSTDDFRTKGWKLEYLGQDSAVGYTDYKFENAQEQNVMPHRAIVKDKDGNVIGTTAVSRTQQEMLSPQYKKAYEIHHVYDNAVQKAGEWVNASGNYSKSKSLPGTRVRFNIDNGTIDMSYKGGKPVIGLTPEQYQIQMDGLMSDITQ